MSNTTNFSGLFPTDNSFGGEVAGIINIIIVVLGVIASILLLVATFAQRILRVPFYLVISSWTIANFVSLLTFVLEIVFMRSGTWPFPDFWCRYHLFVLRAVVLIRLYHMPIACIVAFFSRRYLTLFKNRPWANYVFPLVVSLAVWILFLVLATPYIGSTALRRKDGRKYCDLVNLGVAAALGSIFTYWLPAILSVALLIVWGFLYVRRSTAVSIFIRQRENCEGMVLFIIINVFVVTRLALIIFEYIRATSWLDFMPWSVVQIVMNVVKTIAQCDFFITPTLLLTSVPVYRSVFCLPCRGQPHIVEMEQEPSAMPLKSSDAEKSGEA